MARLANKVALITGGESGIGLATARLFAAEGARVHLAGLRADLLAAAAAELGPGVAEWSVTDVTDEAQVIAALAQASGRFGGLDVLFSNAGISGYATAKHAQVGLMRTAAKEAAARGIRVNSLHPGPTDTEFQREIEVSATGAPPDVAARLFEARIPLSRHACAAEIARCVLFLACADSSFMTGATVAVDGGMHI